MLKPQTFFLIGIILIAMSVVPVMYPQWGWLAGIVLLMIALGQVKSNKYITLRDIKHIGTIKGSGTFVQFIALILFGLNFLETWVIRTVPGTPLVGYLAAVEISWLCPIGLIVLAYGLLAKRKT